MKSGRGKPRGLALGTLLCSLLVSAASANAGDAFLRGGVIFEPRDIGLEGRWRVAFGSDYAVNFAETVFVGFELQTSVFRQDVTSDITATIVPANGFVNVKYKSGSLGARPYGGGGLGLVGDFFFLSGGSEWVKHFGWHLLGGVEIGHLSLELQMERSSAEGADTRWTAYAGFVW